MPKFLRMSGPFVRHGTRGKGSRRAVFHLETSAKLLISFEGILSVSSKCALKSLDNQTDFDSAIRLLIRCGQNEPQDLEFVTYRAPVGAGPWGVWKALQSGHWADLTETNSGACTTIEAI